MWTCPKCGREFKRTNQGHYCGKAPESVEEYMESQSLEAQSHIAGLRDIILRCVPDATERIAWSMPVFKKDNRSISFAACKKHISLYIDEDVLEIVRPQLSEFVIKKNAVYLPYARALPEDVIETIVTQSFAAK